MTARTSTRSSIPTFGALHGRMGSHLARMVPLYDENNTGGASSGGGGGGGGQQTDLQAVIATYQQQVRDLERRIPGEGAVVLDAGQAAQWQQYQQLGTFDVLRQQITERGTFETELTTLRRDGVVREAAGLSNFKEPVLKRLVGDLPIEVREVTVDNKQERRAFVRVNDQDVALTDYAGQHWADFLPSLQVQQQQQQTGTQFPRQTSGGKPTQTDVVSTSLQAFQAARDGQHNPLAPKK